MSCSWLGIATSQKSGNVKSPKDRHFEGWICNQNMQCMYHHWCWEKKDWLCLFFPLPLYLESSLEFLIILQFSLSHFILFILILRIHLQSFFLSLKPKAVHSLDILVFLFQRVCMGCRPPSEALCRTRQNIKTNSHRGSNKSQCDGHPNDGE